ncbi:phage tail protein [Lactiplantibacillus plantarum]|uniref:phage tail family protein n=1 Tax=Lactiplantibacillus plantarum TaxID=1590 RepID=UPI001AB01361|nr:phage tail family protein [Lactiplantibacillus plantarum]MCG0892458.1 phage tail protein [Lactiplantibacillus plantarum]QTF52613.1 phage tail family protein [Lactiplantibacillus plantarum]
MNGVTSFGSTILIQRLDGTIYDLGKLGFRVKKFDVPFTNFQHGYKQVGNYGSKLISSQAQQLVIPMVFDIIATDVHDYELQKLLMMKIFRSDEPFYVINMRIPYLRWKVVAEAFNVTQLNNFWRASDVSVNLDCPDGYAESTATTLSPFTYDSESWGLGMNIPNGEDLHYSFTNQQSFKVYNASNIPLLADDRPVTIRFNGTVSNKLTIQNVTTGQKWNFNMHLAKTDNLVIKGLIPVKNNSQCYGNGLSDHGYIDFKPGWNEMKITGATDFTISFETRFYY